MAIFTVKNVRFSGVAACVPKNVISNFDYEQLTEEERALLVSTTGIAERRKADPNCTTSDLCFSAAEKLLADLKWDKDEVEILIFVSQSRDYILPATSIILQEKLGLPKTCIAFDISLGCSGYVYGLSVIASLMSTAKIKKGLLLAGDISTLSLNKKDKSAYPLFGDAGTATALSYDPKCNPMDFNLQSDGSGAEAIIIPDGGVRNPINDDSLVERKIDQGIWRTNRNLAIDGLKIFNFSITEVPPHIAELLKQIKKNNLDFDYFIFHQANKLIIETIRKLMGAELDKVPYSLTKYGNTSNASLNPSKLLALQLTTPMPVITTL
jgi:3-oxoacyl-[acyl-carrier-protein] synthase-3